MKTAQEAREQIQKQKLQKENFIQTLISQPVEKWGHRFILEADKAIEKAISQSVTSTSIIISNEELTRCFDTKYKLFNNEIIEPLTVSSIFSGIRICRRSITIYFFYWR